MRKIKMNFRYKVLLSTIYTTIDIICVLLNKIIQYL
jgi:hypothetical protein